MVHFILGAPSAFFEVHSTHRRILIERADGAGVFLGATHAPRISQRSCRVRGRLLSQLAQRVHHRASSFHEAAAPVNPLHIQLRRNKENIGAQSLP